MLQADDKESNAISGTSYTRLMLQVVLAGATVFAVGMFAAGMLDDASSVADNQRHDGIRRQAVTPHRCVHDDMDHPPLVYNHFARPQGLPGQVDNVTPIQTSEARRTSVQWSDGTTTYLGTNLEWTGAPPATSPVFQTGTSLGTYNDADCQAMRSTTFQPIRIHLENVGLGSLSAAQQTYVTTTLMPAAKAYFENTLKVAQLQQQSSSYTIRSAGTGTKTVDSTSPQTDIIYPSNSQTTGWDNTDFVLMYAASNSGLCQANTATVAYAGTLEIMACGRPVIGYIHWCENKITSTTVGNAQHDLQYTTALHEMIHALGFSARMFPFFRDSSTGAARTPMTNGYPTDTTPLTITLSNGDSNSASMGTTTIFTPDTSYFPTPATDATLGETRYKLKTSEVLTKARAHFDCSTLDGVELENQGSSANWGSHWEKRIFGDELMVAQATSSYTPLSDVTLALLKDTGFYDITTYVSAYNSDGDLSQGAETNNWLKNKGCTKVTNKCVSTSSGITTSADSDTWCTTTGETSSSTPSSCTYDRKAQGYCWTMEGTSYTGISSSYQYFGDTTTYGGESSAYYSDYCPFVREFETLQCTDSGDSTNAGSTNVLASGQSWGSSSRCFTSNLWQRNSQYNVPSPAPAVGCYPHQCITGSKVLIDIVYSSSQTYRIPCTSSGDTTAASIVNSVMTGSFTCPDPTSTAMCGGLNLFPSLSALTVDSGLSLTPTFVDHEGIYYLAVGAGYSTITVTPTMYTTTATMTQQRSSPSTPVTGTTTAVTSTSGAAVTHTLAAGLNVIDVTVTVPACSSSVTTNCNAESSSKTYTLRVVRGQGLTDTIAESLQLTAAFSDADTFMAEVKAEIVALLNIPAAQVTMYMVSGSSGSATVKYTFSYDSSATNIGEPSGYDANFLSLFSDKDSIMFTDTSTYPKLSTATGLGSTTAVTCNSACSTSCDPTTGLCVSTSGSGAQAFYDDYPMIFWGTILCGLLIIGGFIYCIVKCILREPPREKVSLDKFQVQRPRFKDDVDPDDEDPLIQEGVGIAMGKTAADGKIDRMESGVHRTNAFDALTRQQIEHEYRTSSTELPEKSPVVVESPASSNQF